MDYEKALTRIPTWMAVIAVPGIILSEKYAGIGGAAGFTLGAAAAWLNLRLIVRAVNRIVRLTAAEPAQVKTKTGIRVFLEFVVFATIAFVILKFTGFNLKAAMLGFLVCPAAAIVEIVYELFTYDS